MVKPEEEEAPWHYSGERGAERLSIFTIILQYVVYDDDVGEDDEDDEDN